MTSDDQPRFLGALNQLCAAFGREPTEPLLMAYWAAFGDMDLVAFEAACKRAILEVEYMPVPAVLRKLAGAVPVEGRVAQSWEVVQRAMRRVGAYGSVDFGDPVLHATIRAMGGWPSLCRRETSWLNTFGRAEFAKTYAALWEASITPEQAGHLPGQTEIESANWHRDWRDRSHHSVTRIATGLPASKRHAALLEQAERLQLEAPETPDQERNLERVKGLLEGMGVTL